MSEMPESTLQAPTSVEKEPARGFFQSWYIRITLGLIVILVILAVIGYVAYSEAKSDYNKALTINQYTGMQIVRDDVVEPGVGYQQFQGQYTSLDAAQLVDIEAFYGRQMDECRRLYAGEVDPAANPDQFHRVVCEKSRTQNLLGFTQFMRVVIQPERDAEGNLTGYVVVSVDTQWEE